MESSSGKRVNIEIIEEQMRKYREKLNSIFGVIAFTVSLSILSTYKSLDDIMILSFVLLLSSLFIFALLREILEKYYPKELKELEDNKKHLSKEEYYKFKGLKSEYFSMKAMFKFTPLYVIGFLSYGFAFAVSFEKLLSKILQ